jgi:F-type H+-transporting ATPase subunit a
VANNEKKKGCGCLGCSIPWITLIIILVLIIPMSVWGFMNGGLYHSIVAGETFIKEFHVVLPADILFNIGPLPVTNTILATWVTILLLLIIGLTVTYKPKLIPGKMQTIMEMIIEWLYNFCKDTAGEKNGKRFFPLVATIFLFVMFNALMNLIPGYNSITYHGHHLLRGANTDINTPLALAVISFTCFTFWGLQTHKFGWFKQFFVFWPFTGLKDPGRFLKGWGDVFTGKFKLGCGGVLFGAIDIVVGFLELISYLIRLISFTFRLFGNMLGGEIMVLVFSYLLVFAGFGALQVFYGLEMFFGVIQALIFAGLTLVFSTMAVSSHDEEEHEEHKETK